MSDVAWTIAVSFALMATCVLAPALVFAFVGYRFGSKGVKRLCVCIASGVVIVTLLVLLYVQVASAYGFEDEPEWFLTLARHTLLMPLDLFDGFFNRILPPLPDDDPERTRLPSILLTLLFDVVFYSLPAAFFFAWRDRREQRRASVQPTIQS